MKFSLDEVKKEWRQLRGRIRSQVALKEDLQRGWAILRSGGNDLADRSISEMDLFRLKQALDKIDEQIHHAYRSLGKTYWAHQAQNRPFEEKEWHLSFEQIDDLKKEKEEILGMIESIKPTSSS